MRSSPPPGLLPLAVMTATSMYDATQLERWARQHCLRRIPHLEEGMPSAHADPDRAAPSALPGKVLIVDDDQTLCEALELTLGRGGLQVAWVGSAHDALDRAREAAFDFDVIVTDMTMPVMGGIELCEHLQALRPEVPVVMLSGQATVEAAAAARRAGAFDYLVKPVHAAALALSVDAAIRHHRRT